MSSDELAQFKKDIFNRLWVLAGAFWSITVVVLWTFIPITISVANYNSREKNIDKAFYMLGLVQIPMIKEDLTINQ